MGLFNFSKKTNSNRSNHFYNDEYADKLLSIAIQSNELSYFIIGFPTYEIPFRDLNGFVRHNDYAALKALYRWYEKSNEKESKQILTAIQKAYEDMTVSKLQEHIFSILDQVNFNIIDFKKGNAPFILNVTSIINLIKDNLRINNEMYKKEVYKDYLKIANEKIVEVEKLMSDL